MAKGIRSRRKVLIVDDHPIVRQGLTELISQEADLSACGTAEDADAALQSIRELKPDIVIVDISLRGRNGIDLIKEIRDEYERIPILVLSMHDEALYAERAIRAGANGYIMKQEATEQVIEAARHVLDGETYLSDKMAARLPAFEKGESPLDRLSDRELEVFELIGRGLSTRSIAVRLELSVKTIETHRQRIKEKLGLRNATELTRHAVQWVEGGSSG